MESLRCLIDKHGTGIWVQSKDKKYPMFQILEDRKEYCLVWYENGTKQEVLTDCKTCNDYHVV